MAVKSALYFMAETYLFRDIADDVSLVTLTLTMTLTLTLTLAFVLTLTSIDILVGESAAIAAYSGEQ